VRDGLRAQGIRRRLHFLSAVILGVIAWGGYTTVGQDFARVSDARLLSEPADVTGLIVVIFFALVAIAIFVANAIYWRRALRTLATA
jgi:TRAP-type C4-dicarboxylate transport system permease small subunit